MTIVRYGPVAKLRCLRDGKAVDPAGARASRG